MMKFAVIILALGGLFLGGGIGLVFLAHKQGLAEIAEEIRSTIVGQVRKEPAPIQAINLSLETTHFGMMIIQIPSAVTSFTQGVRTPVLYKIAVSPKERTLMGEWRNSKGQWSPLYEDLQKKEKKLEYKIPANSSFSLNQEFQEWNWGDVDLLRYTLKTPGEADYVWHVTPGKS